MQFFIAIELQMMHPTAIPERGEEKESSLCLRLICFSMG
jgi:hypothetical protein